MNDAMGAVLNLLDKMPETEKLWDISKKSIQTSIQTQRINKEGILFAYETAQDKGLNYDIRKDIYKDIAGMTLADVKAFHAANFKGQNWNIGVMGSKDKIKPTDLMKYGNVRVLTLKDIFGYDEKDFTPAKP